MHLENEPTSPISKHWNGNLDEFVRNLTHPKGPVDRAQSVDIAALDRLETMKLQPTKSTTSDETLDVGKTTENIRDTIKHQQSCDTTNPRKSWKHHILLRKNAKTLSSSNSKDIVEPVEQSFGSQEDEGLGLKDVSFDSSSSGPRVSFQCESSESSEHECSSSQGTTTTSVDSGTHRQYQKRSEKDGKDSKRRRFRRMITRPLRRSHSAGCEKDIPTQNMFVHQQSEDKPEKDTVNINFNSIIVCKAKYRLLQLVQIINKSKNLKCFKQVF